ncbi:L-carnitine dehydratase/bile acid-inducible protein F [Tremella mesenterica]|uniref:L-carnitine dehydratase/bile acid-inducible protein F n=1 Tax=Tremella mesenterica TaxID=5217 RepID=A0A4Q1BLG2_TREME|nr:L-carnitine dehydratase/bile acid-inducible protein F [Tremella mesenterica]
MLTITRQRRYLVRQKLPPLRCYSTPADDRPLAGVKVLDLTRVLAGPLATMMLADLGADVIKVESPRGGDETRSWLPPYAPIPQSKTIPRPDLPPESAYFLQANRGKRSLTLNLKSTKGQEVAKKLVKQADILVENYITGKLSKFGLGYEQCKHLNPSLIYCSITGYGSTGPYAHTPGYDVVIEAEAGLMHITGEKGGQPVKVGVAVTDILTGHYAQSGILAALLKRHKTGKGSLVECSLFESQIASLANIASNYLISGQEASRWGTSHPSIVPYQVFPTSNSFLMIAAGSDAQFSILCRVLGMGWDTEDDFTTNELRVKNRDRLISLIENVLREETTDVWCDKLKGKGVPFAPINNIKQTFNHPQAIARGVVTEIEHPRAGKIKLVSPAVSYDSLKLPISRPPPYLGQHTDEVLFELGYDVFDISQMRDDGII